MIIEWAIGVLLGAMTALVGLVRSLMPGFDWDSLSTVMGHAAQLNGVLPVAELGVVGGLIVGWRLLVAPITALLGRWSFGFKIW